MAFQFLVYKWQLFFLLAGAFILVFCSLPLQDHVHNLLDPSILYGTDKQITLGSNKPLRRDIGADDMSPGVDVNATATGIDDESPTGDHGQNDDVVIQATEDYLRKLVFEIVDETMEKSLALDIPEELQKPMYPGALPDIDETVAICMVIRNQHSDLQEFLTHHYHHLGIRRFYIIDDGSVPALSNHDDYPIPRNSITFVYFSSSERPGNGQMQFAAYNTCHQRFGTRHKWLGFIDADEYLEITRTPGRSMAQFLEDYEQYGALGVSWIIHDSNNRTHKSTIGNRKAYTSCIYDGEDSDNRHIKSFVQSKYYVEPTGPHSFRLNGSMITVGENGDTVTYAFRKPITRDKIALHHYAVKSREDYEEKMARGTPTDHRKDDVWCKISSVFSN
ncbi:hypothetical protein H072_4338 [Dactylellina haptotyla CBS 200.50]|uniref:Glycosyltransferase family 92 protein n=1 Tax=Dactylellina haptotyla (strain CBS 200.50) TaxID=1284197 RepID=S8AKX5_DACHA|nr:hypothetical protein H072_4338 [Dactylellina haptotyla CBS 200.50]